MLTRLFGATKRRVPLVGLGTWNLEQGDRKQAIAAMRRGLELGMTHIDTAEMYGDGEAEKVVGQAIHGRRDEVFLVSKVLPQNASRQGTVAACNRSLERLGTDRLDCYLLHWRGSVPLEETVAGMNDLVEQGKILSWGVSNFDVSDLEELLPRCGANSPACNQVLCHLEERAIEHAVLPWCQEHDIALVAYSPLGHKLFPSPTSAGGRALDEIARARKATPRQVALAFLVAQPGVFVIPKSSNSEHVAENAGAGDLQLSATELAQIDRAFPRGPKKRDLPTL